MNTINRCQAKKWKSYSKGVRHFSFPFLSKHAAMSSSLTILFSAMHYSCGQRCSKWWIRRKCLQEAFEFRQIWRSNIIMATIAGAAAILKRNHCCTTCN